MQTEWLIDPGIAYLNHGGFGALPRPVADAAAEWRQVVEANPTDLFMRRWQGLVDGVRERVAALVNAPASELVFVPNATTGSATVIASLPLQQGDELLTTDHRYGAVRRQLEHAAAQHGARLTEAHVPLDAASAAEVVEAVMTKVTDRTRLVVVDHIASPTGFVFPVADIARAARDAGVPLLVDGAHAPGQVHVDLAAVGADYWVGNLHKWVCSPRARAVLHVPTTSQDRVRPLVPSHDYLDGFQPAFDWTGTFDPIPLLAIPAALDFWEAVGWDTARRRQRTLANDGARRIADALGTRVPVADEFTAAMRLVELPRTMTLQDGRALEARLTTEHKVTAYVTHHSGASFVRVCGQLYNTPDDYARLADALTASL